MKSEEKAKYETAWLKIICQVEEEQSHITFKDLGKSTDRVDIVDRRGMDRDPRDRYYYSYR